MPIWLRFMDVATAGKPVRDFVMPEGIERRSVDVRTGLLARSDDVLKPGELPIAEVLDDGEDPIPTVLPEGVIAEVFAAGTAPVQNADDAPPMPLELMEQGGLAP